MFSCKIYDFPIDERGKFGIELLKVVGKVAFWFRH